MNHSLGHKVPVSSEAALHFPATGNGRYHSETSAVAWARVLAVIAVALSVSVAILTVTLVKDEAQLLRFGESSWAPLPTTDATLATLFFGSCSSQKTSQPYWDTLMMLQPDLVVLMGDNVYFTCSDEQCKEGHDAYSQWADHPSFLGAKGILPMVATLDDHDYGQGDCHSDNPYKDVAKQMFVDFFNIPDERNRMKDGVFGAYEWGPLGQRVQLILLDTRYARSPFLDTDEPMASGKEVYMPDMDNRDKQMLSPQQWMWLQEQVSKPADVRIVVSSIQVLSEGNGFEGWRMLPYERDRLVDLLQNQTNTSTLVLSGDRHKGGYYQYQNLTEVTASSWTHTIPYGAYSNCTDARECDEVDERRIGDFVRVNHFASVELHWENRTMTVSLRRTEASQESIYSGTNGHLTGNAGEPVQSHTYPIL